MENLQMWAKEGMMKAPEKHRYEMISLKADFASNDTIKYLHFYVSVGMIVFNHFYTVLVLL